MSEERRKQIREWGYEEPGLEVIIEGRSISIRQFDGWSDLKLSIGEHRHARELAAALEAWASREEGLYDLGKLQMENFSKKQGWR